MRDRCARFTQGLGCLPAPPPPRPGGGGPHCFEPPPSIEPHLFISLPGHTIHRIPLVPRIDSRLLHLILFVRFPPPPSGLRVLGSK